MWLKNTYCVTRNKKSIYKGLDLSNFKYFYGFCAEKREISTLKLKLGQLCICLLLLQHSRTNIKTFFQVKTILYIS